MVDRMDVCVFALFSVILVVVAFSAGVFVGQQNFEDECANCDDCVSYAEGGWVYTYCDCPITCSMKDEVKKK